MSQRQLPAEDYLKRLAGEINAEHRDVTTTALEGARRIGDKLLLAQQELGEGETWNAWIERHCEFSRRTAFIYTQISRNWERIDRQATSIAGALTLLRPPRPDVDAGFPPLPADDEAEYLEMVQQDADRAAAERQAKAEKRQERKGGLTKSQTCPKCGHRFS